MMKSENPETSHPFKHRPDSKLVLLIGILIVTALLWILQIGSPRGAAFVERLPGKKVSQKFSNAGDPVPFRAMLEEKPPEFETEKRNIFNFSQPALPPSPAPEAVEEQIAEAPPEPVCGNQICEENEDYQNCPDDCQPAPPPDIPLRYIGYMNEKAGAVVFLTDGKEIYMGRENDIIANRYRIQKITDQNVELGYLNLNQSRSIPFQGNSDN